jgi:protocatechuate 3,4-dioxygenase beta subunit
MKNSYLCLIYILVIDLISTRLCAQEIGNYSVQNSTKESYSNEERPVDKFPQYELPKDQAQNKIAIEQPSAFTPRTPTPSRFFSADLSMPDIFVSSNNLAKKAGSFYRAFGEIIFIQGSVNDSFGVPISGAVVEIWQTNSAGKYHTLLEENSEYIDKFFNMSGRAITDNLGNYHFITIMPGASSGRAPHINFNIYHEKFGKVETEMYFANHPYNQTDYQYLVYSKEEQKLLTADVRHSNILNTRSIKLCTFNITMRGIHQYKRY